ncbi:MAG: pyruvate carboxylase subunit B [Kiritimatiellia bacterium]|jgi:oxaloacetate decarboxylase alpha subunit|nr:pyruvate carboxylase subunit B [Kiritimatiellia bacterium]MDP6847731.1 pyruvate carboxylase subunit B [Kiritimatiellia bacterium]
MATTTKRTKKKAAKPKKAAAKKPVKKPVKKAVKKASKKPVKKTVKRTVKKAARKTAPAKKATARKARPTITAKARKSPVATKPAKRIPLRITDTTLRDAHQSLWATRMRTSDIMEIIDVIDGAGYYSLEVWGGATFDVCLRFLRENPWERLRQIKSRAKKTPLQMLLRGQNVLGYKHYPDDLLDRFVELAVENGVDIFRIFDALNDNRNLEQAIKSVKQHGGHAQGTICYTISPVHTVDEYVRIAMEQVAMGIDSLVIKDMAGILSPISAEKLIKALVKNIRVPIQLHTHSTSGMGTATYVEAVRAGAGAIDCAISVMSGFSSQPPVETMLAIFDETPYNANLDVEALRKICRFFTGLAPSRKLSHQPINPIDPEILLHHIPGGMISNLRSQLEQQGALDKLPDVLEELPRTRKDMGYPPLVTPTSQIIGVQAVMNVLAGERYAMVPQETKDYVRGLYGRSPAPIKPAIKRKILGKIKTITGRPADRLKPMLPNATDGIDPKLITTEEDIISFCLFPEPANDFFKWRDLPLEERPSTPADLERVKIEQEGKGRPVPAIAPPKPFLSQNDYNEIQGLIGKVNDLGLTELTIRRNDLNLSMRAEGATTSRVKAEALEPVASEEAQVEAITEEPAEVEAGAEQAGAEAEGPTVDAPLNGTFYRSAGPGKPEFAKEGDSVKSGATICIVEAMKLFNEINAPCDCKVVKFMCDHGDAVEKGQPLVVIEEK